MNDRTPESPMVSGQPADAEPQDGETETPVGDMFAEGQTDIGPLPSVTHIENLKQADLPAAAESVGEADPNREG